MTHKVIPYTYYRAPNGKPYSIYSSYLPPGSVMVGEGYTIAWSDGTTGTGRPAFASLAEAKAYLAKVPKGFKGMSVMAS